VRVVASWSSARYRALIKGSGSFNLEGLMNLTPLYNPFTHHAGQHAAGCPVDQS
jgi:hypothetical protein